MNASLSRAEEARRAILCESVDGAWRHISREPEHLPSYSIMYAAAEQLVRWGLLAKRYANGRNLYRLVPHPELVETPERSDA